MKERIFRVNTVSEAKTLLKRKAGIVEVPWCGKDVCGHNLEEQVQARLLGTPEDATKVANGKCVVCGEQASNVVRVALAY
jgi:prolyl-tRNA synthetase